MHWSVQHFHNSFDWLSLVGKHFKSALRGREVKAARQQVRCFHFLSLLVFPVHVSVNNKTTFLRKSRKIICCLFRSELRNGTDKRCYANMILFCHWATNRQVEIPISENSSNYIVVTCTLASSTAGNLTVIVTGNHCWGWKTSCAATVKHSIKFKCQFIPCKSWAQCARSNKPLCLLWLHFSVGVQEMRQEGNSHTI